MFHNYRVSAINFVYVPSSEKNNFSESFAPNLFDLINWLKLREYLKNQRGIVFHGVSSEILKTWH